MPDLQMQTGIRAFIALKFELSDLLDYQRKIRAIDYVVSAKNLRWLEPESLHLTLHFFRHLPTDKIQPLEKQLHNQFTDLKPLLISFKQLRFFPDHHPSVLATMARLTPALVDCRNALNDTLTILDLPVDQRPFTPHLSLARTNYRWSTAPEATPIEFELKTNKLSLVQSILQPIREHIVLKEILLNSNE